MAVADARAGSPNPSDPPFLRALGVTMAIETGARAATSVVLRLLVGYFSGLPLEAISFNGALAFFLTMLLEIPTGLFADLHGRHRSIALGCRLQAAAILVLAAGIISYHAGCAGALWALLAVEAVLDAAGNSLISGAREALFQEVMESQTHALNDSARRKIRAGYLGMAERFGRWIPLATTELMVAATVLCEILFHAGVALLPLLAVWWIALERSYARLARFHETERARTSGLTRGLRALVRSVRAFWRGLGTRRGPLLRRAAVHGAGLFLYILIQANLLITLLRDHELSVLGGPLAETLALANLFLAGRLLRSYLLPKLADRVNAGNVIRIAAAALVAWGAFLPAAGRLAGDPRGAALLCAALVCVDPLLGMLQRPAQSLFLAEVDAELRATVNSLLSAGVLAVHGLLAVYLTWSGLGVPTVLMTGALTMGCALLAGLAAFSL